MDDYKYYCKFCGKEIGPENFDTWKSCCHGQDYYCNNIEFCNEHCREEYEKQFIVETYRGHPIYRKVFGDDNRIGYTDWFRKPYGHKTLVEVHNWIDLRLDRATVFILDILPVWRWPKGWEDLAVATDDLIKAYGSANIDKIGNY